MTKGIPSVSCTARHPVLGSEDQVAGVPQALCPG